MNSWYILLLFNWFHINQPSSSLHLPFPPLPFPFAIFFILLTFFASAVCFSMMNNYFFCLFLILYIFASSLIYFSCILSYMLLLKSLITLFLSWFFFFLSRLRFYFYVLSVANIRGVYSLIMKGTDESNSGNRMIVVLDKF